MNELFSIKAKCYVLSGGTGALGGAIGDYLVKNGAHVILLGRSADKLKKKQKALEIINPGHSHTYMVDVMNSEAMEVVKDQIGKQFQKLDGLINLAGGNIPGATLQSGQSIFDVGIEDTRKVMDLNLFGTVVPSIVLGQLMTGQGFGSIVNISSMASKQAISRVLGYSMAKAGVDIFTKWMAHELASKFSDKIRVNAIAPGFFIGNQNRGVLINEDGSYTDRSNKIMAKTPMARFGEVSELNGMIHYLLSDASSFVTGSVFDVDGGFNSFSGV
jgi:NAD(P)-dependent dehydrogenase (short-subunit alcohol dehydrogenase family)